MIRWSIVLGTALLSVSGVASASAQGQGTDLRDESATSVHASASSGLMVMRTIYDVTTRAKWDFGPSQQLRGAVDFAIGDGTSIGVSLGYASVSTIFTRVTPVFTGSSCLSDCEVSVEHWNGAITLHIGDKPGLHTIAEGSIGLISMGNFRHKTSGEKVGPKAPDLDGVLSLGFGVGYTASRRFQITLVQEVGFSIHELAGEAASPTNALTSILTTRLAIRAGIGR